MMRVWDRRLRAAARNSDATTGRILRFVLLSIVAVVIFVSLASAKAGTSDSLGATDSVGVGSLASGSSASGAYGDVGDASSSSFRPTEGDKMSEGAVDTTRRVADTEKPFTRDPPFALPASLRPQGYTQGRDIETWRAVSDASCRDVAREILVKLRSTGMELKEAGYLDLFGEAWGCTLEDHGEASVTVTLIPENPFSQRNSSNPLRMTLIRIAVPELGMPGQDSQVHGSQG
jgi:hypothetical protein